MFDLILVGGGLQSALLALAAFERLPRARVALIERSSALGGNHTWSFHADDLPASARAFVAPLLVAEWPAYDVAFASLERRLEAPYASISSARVDEVVRAGFARAAGSRLFLGEEATALSAHEVQLASGAVLRADVVVDARGPEPTAAGAHVAFQKFLGLELSVRRVPRDIPFVMDARVPQEDGFRFVYTLPLAPNRMLVEDTYYADSPTLDRDALRARVLAYAAEVLGTPALDVVREEVGVLPLPLEHDGGPAVDPGRPLVLGFRGGYCHPTTGYSFPLAVRVALVLTDPAATTPALRTRNLEALVRANARQRRFGVILNRLLFRATPPGSRAEVLARFYRLPPSTIRRFYAMQTTLEDRSRVVCGRPPAGVSIAKALRAVVSP